MDLDKYRNTKPWPKGTGAECQMLHDTPGGHACDLREHGKMIREHKKEETNIRLRFKQDLYKEFDLNPTKNPKVTMLFDIAREDATQEFVAGSLGFWRMLLARFERLLPLIQ